MAISLTTAAADRVQSFLTRRGHGLGLRLAVKKTGCSGYAYVVNYADDIGSNDVVFEDRGVKVIVDAASEYDLRKFLAEVSLVDQPFVKDPDVKVGKLLKDAGAECRRFVRYEVGEGIEVERGDFAAEEWDDALTAARDRRTGPTADYLLGVPLLGDLLEEGFTALGYSCEDYEVPL